MIYYSLNILLEDNRDSNIRNAMSDLNTLYEHLLKFQYCLNKQQENYPSWMGSINRNFITINILLRNPDYRESFLNKPFKKFKNVYNHAKSKAQYYNKSTFFPEYEDCDYLNTDEILTQQWLFDFYKKHSQSDIILNDAKNNFYEFANKIVINKHKFEYYKE